MLSSSGNAIAVPNARSTVRRDRCIFVMYMADVSSPGKVPLLTVRDRRSRWCDRRRVLYSPHLERCDVDDTENQRRPPVAFAIGVPQELSQRGLIVIRDRSSERIRQELFRHGGGEFVTLAEHLSKRLRSGDPGAVGQRARGINRCAAVAVTPLADRIEILESESDGIHPRVTGGTDGIGPMLFHAIA